MTEPATRQNEFRGDMERSFLVPGFPVTNVAPQCIHLLTQLGVLTPQLRILSTQLHDIATQLLHKSS